MANILERIQAKLELFRLEQRYTRRRNRRSTFVSNAIYVDGEYVYQTPVSTGSSSTSTVSATASRAPTSPANKARNRLSMPTFGSAKMPSRTQDWRKEAAIDERY